MTAPEIAHEHDDTVELFLPPRVIQIFSIVVGLAGIAYLAWSVYRYYQERDETESLTEAFKQSIQNMNKHEVIVAVAPHVPDPTDESPSL